MFDGDQFHQFIASSRSSLPIPLSFSLHGNPASNFSTAFDPFPPSLLHHQEPPPPITKKHVPLNISTNLGLESERSMDPWSNDEVLALLKLRSSMEIWFPDFTWEHVSRKLSEIGFKRSREECKEKFEEESRHFDSVNFRGNYTLDEIYEDEAGKSMENAKEAAVDDEEKQVVHKNMEKNEFSEQQVVKVKKKKRRRSKDKKFEMLKGFCESVVKKMMTQQEELQKKLLEDIVKRDDEKIAREEAWKNQEMKRMKMEIEMRAKEQASAEKRQATIIAFLNNFTSSSSHQDQNLRNKIDTLILKVNNNSTTTSCKTPNHEDEDQEKVENPISDQSQLSPPSPSSSKPNYYSVSLLQTASSSDHQTTPSSSLIFESSGGDIGKRWPRDEVLALINLRCKMSNINGESDQSNSGGAITKGPLWERISQGMMEMGYKRSAKRCKEKWENINKYFRKTKDSSKKRSVNSRTCPYFQQLSCLYSQGTYVAPNNNMQENHQ